MVKTKQEVLGQRKHKELWQLTIGQEIQCRESRKVSQKGRFTFPLLTLIPHWDLKVEDVLDKWKREEGLPSRQKSMWEALKQYGDLGEKQEMQCS